MEHRWLSFMPLSLFPLLPQWWRLLSAPLIHWRGRRSLPLEGCVKSWWTPQHPQPSVSLSSRLHPQVIDMFQHQCSVLSAVIPTHPCSFLLEKSCSCSLTHPYGFLPLSHSSLLFPPPLWLILCSFLLQSDSSFLLSPRSGRGLLAVWGV